MFQIDSSLLNWSRAGVDYALQLCHNVYKIPLFSIFPMNYRCWHLLNNKVWLWILLRWKFLSIYLYLKRLFRDRVFGFFSLHLENMSMKCWPNRKSVEHNRYDDMNFWLGLALCAWNENVIKITNRLSDIIHKRKWKFL